MSEETVKIPDFVFGAWNLTSEILAGTINIFADAYIIRAPDYIYNLIYQGKDYTNEPELLMYYFRIKNTAIVNIEFDTQWIGPFVSKLKPIENSSNLTIDILTEYPGSDTPGAFNIIPTCPISEKGFQNEEEPTISFVGAKVRYVDTYSGDFWSAIIDPITKQLSFTLKIKLPNGKIVDKTKQAVKNCRDYKSLIGDCLPPNVYANISSNFNQPTCPPTSDEKWKTFTFIILAIIFTYLILKLVFRLFFKK